MSDYEKLVVYQKAQALAIDARELVRPIRGSENARFKSQIVRAAFSIPGNIVEGNGLQTLINETEANGLIDRTREVRRMLHGLLDYLAKG